MKKIISFMLAVIMTMPYLPVAAVITESVIVSDYKDTMRSMNFTEEIWRMALEAADVTYDTDGRITSEKPPMQISGWDNCKREKCKPVFLDGLHTYVQTGTETDEAWRKPMGVTVSGTSLEKFQSKAALAINGLNSKVVKDQENETLNPNYPRQLSRYCFNGQSFIYDLQNSNKEFKASKVVVKFVTYNDTINSISVGTNRSNPYSGTGDLDSKQESPGTLNIDIQKNNDYTPEQIKWKNSSGEDKYTNWYSYSATLTGFTTDDTYFGFKESTGALFVYAIDVYADEFSADFFVEGVENHKAERGSVLDVKIKPSVPTIIDKIDVYNGMQIVGTAEKNGSVWSLTINAEHGVYSLWAKIKFLDGEEYSTERYSFKTVRAKNYSTTWEVEDYKDEVRSTNFSDELVREFLEMWDVSQGQTVQYDSAGNIVTALNNGYSWHAKESTLSNLHIYTEKLDETDKSYYYHIFVPYSQIQAKENPLLNPGYDKKLSRKLFGFQRIRFDLGNEAKDSIVSKVEFKCFVNVNQMNQSSVVCKTDSGRALTVSARPDPEYNGENPLKYFANEDKKAENSYNYGTGWAACIVELNGFEKNDQWFSVELPSSSSAYYTDINVYHNTINADVSVMGAEGQNVISGTNLEFKLNIIQNEFVTGAKVIEDGMEIGRVQSNGDSYVFNYTPSIGAHSITFDVETDFGVLTTKPIELNVMEENELKKLYEFSDSFYSTYDKYFSDSEFNTEYDIQILDGAAHFEGNDRVYRRLPSVVDFNESNDLWYSFDFTAKEAEGFCGIALGQNFRIGINKKDGRMHPYISCADVAEGENEPAISEEFFGKKSLEDGEKYTAVVRIDTFENKIAMKIYPCAEKCSGEFDIEAEYNVDGDIFDSLAVAFNTGDNGAFDIFNLSSELLTYSRHFIVNGAISDVLSQTSYVTLTNAQNAISSISEGMAKTFLNGYIEPMVELNKNTPPIVEYVGIAGTYEAEKTLSGEVKYTDLGFNYDCLKYSWTVGGRVISTDAQVRPDIEYQGQSLTLTVTPMSLWGIEGKAVSKTVTLKKTQTGSSIKVGTGGGGIGGGSVGGGNTGNGGSETSTTPEVKPVAPFTDIEGHWAQSEITELYKKKIVNGRSKESFEPDETITRAEIAQLIYKAFDPEDRSGEGYIVDVPESAWYKKAVTAVRNARIMMGKDDGLFAPNDLLTREELAKILYTVYEYKYIGNTQAAAKGFCTDEASISDWAREYVAKAYATEIMNGFDDGTFRPQAVTTRAEVAVAIYRLMGKMK